MKIRQPYRYPLTEEKFKALHKSLKAICKSSDLQCDLVDRKPLTYGYKLGVFLLGYRVGFCGDEKGISEAKWVEVTTTITALILEAIPEAEIQTDNFSETKKFALRWEAYIQTREP